MLDAATGSLTAYALDGEAERPVRLRQERIEIVVRRIDRQPVSLLIALDAVANPLTGETRGDTSEFTGQAESLRGATGFDASVRSISIRGQEFQNIEFNFPRGNEDPH